MLTCMYEGAATSSIVVMTVLDQQCTEKDQEALLLEEGSYFDSWLRSSCMCRIPTSVVSVASGSSSSCSGGGAPLG